MESNASLRFATLFYFPMQELVIIEYQLFNI